VKHGDAVLLLVTSFALKHATRRDTPASSLWCRCQLIGQKWTRPKLASPLLSPLLWAICWWSNELSIA